MSTIGTFSKDFTKSACLIPSPPRRKANFNDIPVLGSPAHLNFRGSNNKKKKKRQSWRRSSSCIRSHDYTVNEKQMQQGLMYRRQLLLASTSLPLNPQQMMMAVMPPSPPILTDYQKLANAVQEAEKIKNTSHGRPELNDVVSWLSSSEPLKLSNLYKSPDELSGIVTVPGAQELLREINEKEVVTARVRRPAAFKLKKDKEEEVVLEGVEVTDEKPLCFDVYIRLGQDDDDDEEELYAGTFSHMPPRKKQRGRQKNKAVSEGPEEGEKRVRRCCLRLGMNGMLVHPPPKAHPEESVTVKLVPTFKLDEDAIKVESIFIDYS